MCDLLKSNQVKCIKSFSVDKYNDDGYLIDDEYVLVEEGSIWELDENKSRVIDGDGLVNEDLVVRNK